MKGVMKVMGRYKKLMKDLDDLSRSKGVLGALDEVFSLDEGVILNAMSLIENDNRIEEEDFSAYEIVLNGVFNLQGLKKDEVAEVIKECKAQTVSELFEKACVTDSRGTITMEEYLNSLLPSVIPSGYNFAVYEDGELQSSRGYTVYDLFHNDTWCFNKNQNFKSLVEKFQVVWTTYRQICTMVYGSFSKGVSEEMIEKFRLVIPVIDDEIECNKFMNDAFLRLKSLELAAEVAKDVLKEKELLEVELKLTPIQSSFFSFTKLFNNPKFSLGESSLQGLSVAVLKFGN